MSSPALEATLESLLKRGLPEVEVLAKRGRSRRFELIRQERERAASSFTQEKGWAVRAGDRRGSFFACGTGEVPPDGPWPPAYAPALRLPAPEPPLPWKQPSDFDAPLIGEREGFALVEGIARELAGELPGAWISAATLEDGSSEGEIASSRGLRAAFRGRLAALRLEATGPGRAAPRVAIDLAEREARRFHPKALARRLADRLAVGGAPGLAEGEERTGDLLLAPPVAARLLGGLVPLFYGPRPDGEISAILGSATRVGSEALTILDDGRFPGGALESPIDGEGMPTREVAIVERGLFGGPVLAWWQARGTSGPGSAPRGQTSGVSRRASWRDLPAPGPTHLYVRPDPKASVAQLLGALASGSYLIDALGPPRFDFATGSFTLPVCGLTVENGRATAPIGHALLAGEISDLLRGVAAVGRDLAFLPQGGMIGSPTLLVRGLTLRAW
ncbi:MAG TPA: metallopeptidase TldD-related protein [Thermoanaerobaculia bacterium]|nr:metallopeptidase TldD-related protein [Thermoanaerobaculia bacterium]